jgi:hypothetical protein
LDSARKLPLKSYSSASEKRLTPFFFIRTVFFATIPCVKSLVRPFQSLVWNPHYETQVGGAIVVGDVKVPKRPYSAPSFEIVDVSAARTELEAKTTSEDVDTRRMLSLIDKALKEKKSVPNTPPLSLRS